MLEPQFMVPNQTPQNMNHEEIVGAHGYATSTFGNKRHSRGNGSMNNEETLGISHQVQQMIASRKIDVPQNQSI